MKTNSFPEMFSIFQPEDSSLRQNGQFSTNTTFQKVQNTKSRNIIKTLIWIVISIIAGLILGQLH